MYTCKFGEDPIFGGGLWVYYRGLNDYQYHFEVDLRYHLLQLYKEYGTIWNHTIGNYLGPNTMHYLLHAVIWGAGVMGMC